jgi:hypothetical protein
VPPDIVLCGDLVPVEVFLRTGVADVAEVRIDSLDAFHRAVEEANVAVAH